MSKERIKQKDVDVELEDGEIVKIVVKRPSSNQLTKAQKIGAKVWTEAVRDGLFTKLTLNEFMRVNGIWNEEKESQQNKVTEEIQGLERDIALGVNGKRLKVSEGKEKALKIRRLRNQLRELISEKIGLEANTAEGLSDNAKFNFLVAGCTYYPDGQKVYSNLAEYEEKSDDAVAFSAAAALGEMIYNLDKGYEEGLPENQFLKRFKLVDEDLSLIDKEGNKIDVDGTKVNDKGWLINDEGSRVDRDGNLLSDAGQILLQADYEDDINDPEPEKPKKTKKAKEDNPVQQTLPETEEVEVEEDGQAGES
jgi:hypothetical protein